MSVSKKLIKWIEGPDGEGGRTEKRTTWQLEQLEIRDVPSGPNGLTIPSGHPRLWFTPERTVQAQTWYAANPFTPPANDPQQNAFAYRLTGNTSYAQTAITALMNFTISQSELDGVASDNYRWNDWVPVVYDWCYEQMTPAQRQTFTTRYNGYTTAMMGKSWGGPGMPANNYYWGIWRNELNWGIATYGDNAQAETYINNAMATRWDQDFVPWAATSGKGGVLQEGTQYGRYMAGYPTIPLQTAILEGRNLLAESNFYTEAAYSLLYSTSTAPLTNVTTNQSYYQLFPFNDDESSGGFPGAGDSSYANMMTVLAGNLANTPLAGYARNWMARVGATPANYVRAVDTGGPSLSYNGLPTDYYTAGPGYLYAKNNWSSSATSLMFQLGGLSGVGHEHQDAGSFQITRNGRWLTKESTGYSSQMVGFGGAGLASVSSTLAQNGLMVNALGQASAYANGNPTVTRLESQPNYVFASVNLTPSYKSNDSRFNNAAVVSVVRDFIYVRDLDALIAFDRVQSTGSQGKTFLLHFPNAPTISGNTVLGLSGNQALKLTSLTPSGQSAPTYQVVNETPASPDSSTDYQYRLEATTSGQAQSYLINVLQARDAAGADLVVSMGETATTFSITLTDPVTGKTAVINLAKGMNSTGGSFGYSPSGLPANYTPLTTTVATVAANVNGVSWNGNPPPGNPLSSFQVTAPTTTIAGNSITVTVSALTAAATVYTGYTGTVHFASSDSQATLPANYTFTATDQGTHSFTITLKTAGTQTVTVNDTVYTLATGTAGLTVQAATTTAFSLSGFPATTVAGTPQNFTVRAVDAYGNTASGYTGTVQFSSSDAAASLPANYTFTASDAGQRSFSATLNTVGTKSLTVSTVATPLLTGTQGGISVVPAGTGYTLWDNSATPSILSDSDTNSVELGVRFVPSTSGMVTGVRFYKGAANTGTHIGRLWDSAGNLLAQVTFTNESASGWQQAAFATPVTVQANTAYVISYYAPNGRYSTNGAYFVNAYSRGPLTAPASSQSVGNGRYRYGVGGGFPSNTYNASNYWVDVVFNTVDAVPPTVAGRTPAAGATGVSVTTQVSATFSEAVLANTVSVVLRDPQNNTISGTATYNSATQTVTFVPSANLSLNTTYTVTVSGAQDAAGNQMTPDSWSFTTATAGGRWTQSGTDFAGGTFSSTASGASGGVQLAASFVDNFNGPSLSSSWTRTNWASGASLTFSNGQLAIANAAITTVNAVNGAGVVGLVNFVTRDQHFGLATGLASVSGNSWVMFSTSKSTMMLYARVNINGVTQDIKLGTIPVGYHDYAIRPSGTGYAFFIDGTQVAHSGAVPSTPFKMVVSSATSTPIRADRVQLTTYKSSGTFTSVVFDAGQSVTWGAVNWTANLPTGTSVSVQVRTGSTVTPGASWSSWSTVSNGNAVGAANRYIQYRVVFSSNVGNTETPLFSSIAIDWA